jgi:hypothetical protein
MENRLKQLKEKLRGIDKKKIQKKEYKFIYKITKEITLTLEYFKKDILDLDIDNLFDILDKIIDVMKVSSDFIN